MEILQKKIKIYVVVNSEGVFYCRWLYIASRLSGVSSSTLRSCFKRGNTEYLGRGVVRVGIVDLITVEHKGEMLNKAVNFRGKKGGRGRKKGEFEVVLD